MFGRDGMRAAVRDTARTVSYSAAGTRDAADRIAIAAEELVAIVRAVALVVALAVLVTVVFGDD